MRLDFCVLWIDDQQKPVRDYSEALAIKLRKEGFELNVIPAKSIAEAKKTVKKSVFADQIDLVLVDYDLGKGQTGDTFLPELRQTLEYKEIVFYSSKPTVELRKLAYESGVEGVYCTDRDSLVDTAAGVFEALVKKVLDIDHSRGIVLGATSDIDEVVFNALVLIQTKMKDLDVAAAKQAIVTTIGEKVAKLTATANTATIESTLESLLDLHELYTSSDRLRLLKKLIKGLKGSEAANLDKKLGAYINDILHKRNIVAHVRMVVMDDGARVLRSREGKTLSESDLRTLRTKLLEYRAHFNEVMNFMEKGKTV